MKPTDHNSEDQNREAFEGLSDEERLSFSDLLPILNSMDDEHVPIEPERVQAIKSQLEAYASPKTSMPRIYFLKQPWLRAAAGFAGLLFILAAWFGQSETIRSIGPAPVHISLADGTHIELNNGSTLTYRPNISRWLRKVSLEGEAFFDVAGNSNPFIVQTNHAEIKVLGTQFNVRSSPLSQNTDVYLFEGRVQLAALDNPAESRILRPGDFATIAPAASSGITLQEASHEQLPIWRQKQPSFSNKTLREVFVQIETLYAIRVQTSDDINLDQKIHYLVAKPVTSETLLADICRITGLSYRPIFNGFEVFPSPASSTES